MSSGNPQLTMTTFLSGNTVTTTRSAPFPTSAEMEALQHQLGALRILKTASSADEQSEAHYRRLVYADYEECVEALSSTTDSIDHTVNEVLTYLQRIDCSLVAYFEFLADMDSQTEQLTPSECLGQMQHVTNLFADDLDLFFRKQIWTEVLKLYRELWSVEDATELLRDVLCSSWEDGILDLDQCVRLLRELRNRKAEMARALKGIEAAVSEVQDRTERFCKDAARFLGRSKVNEEEGCEALGMWLESIGKEIGNITFYWERTEEEDEDNFRMEG
ncbi:hypothetical protein EPUS_00712 [Endocarpon pusillum Z07020]|uniref:Uncharacterized protein n=1 Tax=Endocarpon pusillum (strain Z07020 / HMAS-L-300199) TaxID=1263415 RepID=U1GAN8_ENDPU|nr:uncharacterized protein EPUS_00712 [Endocarpon pusillum Z07020]ERF74582.1 hypothetical protein EPUS_00712 [Endocarpon pusillum Z07020]